MSKLTVSELINKLKEFPENSEVIFQNNLTLYRVDDRGGGENPDDCLVHFEFNELFKVSSE